jgi:formate-dependent nitrite reductase cytochrome c552 subunit
MGCHSHKQNAHEFSVCSTSEAGAKDTSLNCITCHMPKIDGSATTVRISKQHAFHGFAGSRVAPEMLSKYVSIDINKDKNSFKLLVNNQAPHNLLTHPLRVVELRSVLIRDHKKTQLKTHTFVKIIGHEGKPSMPWVATEVLKDTMLKANETRTINFDTQLQSGDTIEVELGFYVVNPKALKKLNLDGNKELEKFTVLKRTHFNIK